MNKLDLFEAELQAINDTYLRPEASDPADFLMRSAFVKWLDFGAGILGMRGATDMFNHAIIYGGRRHLALLHQLSMTGVTLEGQVRELPSPQSFDPGRSLAGVRVNLNDQAWSLSEWAQRLHGVEVAALADDGVRILGALAVMPPGSQLRIIYSEDDYIRMAPDIPYHLLGPLPSDQL